VYSSQCTVCSVQFPVYSLQCTVPCVQFPVYTSQCTIPSVLKDHTDFLLDCFTDKCTTSPENNQELLPSDTVRLGTPESLKCIFSKLLKFLFNYSITISNLNFEIKIAALLTYKN